MNDGVARRNPTGSHQAPGRARGVGAVAVAIVAARREDARRILGAGSSPVAQAARGAPAFREGRNWNQRNHDRRGSKATASPRQAMHERAKALIETTL